MGPHDYWVGAVKDFVFAALFLALGPSLASFLYRKTRCRAAALLVAIGSLATAVGLSLLGAGTLQVAKWDVDGSPPYAMLALVCQVGGALMMAGGLLFVNEYTGKLIAAGALDPSLRSSPLGLRSRRLDEASSAECRARVAAPR